MSAAVHTLWIILLVVTVLVLPYLVYLLHTTWQAARSIQRYFAEMEKAGLGVAENTGHIQALHDTITMASGMLEATGDMQAHAESIRNTLAERASA